jgi:hypothetical protein
MVDEAPTTPSSNEVVQYSGRTEGDLIVFFDAPASKSRDLVGRIVPVRVNSAENLGLRGELQAVRLERARVASRLAAKIVQSAIELPFSPFAFSRITCTNWRTVSGFTPSARRSFANSSTCRHIPASTPKRPEVRAIRDRTCSSAPNSTHSTR